ncbi:cytochrome c3 family protein [Geomobilimonas luticola]|uniref:Cytochrome C n=1 Tax=Geomobilimonas luticola TaxID=1114878 RepID=A0ABS5SEK2_9BACT|nr:cytochrome c3 family protein [Geomobilimonas luticola]MBT0653773.1 cytochrome C [Geomobilimonas luticola]
MKKVLAVVAVASLMAAATVAGAASIKNSKHDLSSTGGQTVRGDTNQLCVFCHTPHNAVQNGYPLWNRSNPAGSAFKLYSSSGMQNGYTAGGNAGASTGFTADSVSLYCMSCHDGVTSVGAVYNKPADKLSGITMQGTKADGSLLGTSTANLGTDLQNDHPVNFNVTSNLDPAIAPLSGATMKTSDITNALPLFKSARGNTSLECASCHAVHDPANVPFLRTTIEGSKLCLGCHIK